MLNRPKVVNNKLGDLGSDTDVNRLLTVIKPSASAVAAPSPLEFYRAFPFIGHFLFSTGFIQVL